MMTHPLALSFTNSLDDLIAASIDDENPLAKIAVAVSGGADSMALLHLASAYAQARKIKLYAFTVDHALRPTSAAEARDVAAYCAAQNIAHRTLLWQGEKPTTAIQDAARNARRELLFAACKAEKITHLLFAHQADDQAETVIMRMTRGTGLRGLLAIHALSTDEASGIVLLRPLLEQRRADLRAYCVAQQIPFHDDPSNDDTQFERVRVRQALQNLPDFASGLTRTLVRLSEIDETLDLLATEWLEEEMEPISDDTIWLPMSFSDEMYPPVQMRVLEGALLEILPDNFTPADIPLDGLERLLETLHSGTFKGQTLAGVQIKPHKADGVQGLLFLPAPQRRMQ